MPHLTVVSSWGRLKRSAAGATPRRPARNWIVLGLLALLFATAAGASVLLVPVSNAPGVRPTLLEAIASKHIRLGVDHAPRPLRPADYEVRRAEGFESVVADDLARAWGIRPELVEIPPQQRMDALRDGRVDALMVRLGEQDPLASEIEIVSSGYDPALAPIMRSDTKITSWDQLAGHKICFSDQNGAARNLVARIGGIAEPATVPAKSLAAMRSGQCDAAIDDADMVRVMMKMERWQKYRATLPPRDQMHLVFAVAKGDRQSAQALNAVARHWRWSRQWGKWIGSWVADVDFEAYLEQDAPDCH